jgi:hypothetical protein
MKCFFYRESKSSFVPYIYGQWLGSYCVVPFPKYRENVKKITCSKFTAGSLTIGNVTVFHNNYYNHKLDSLTSLLLIIKK